MTLATSITTMTPNVVVADSVEPQLKAPSHNDLALIVIDEALSSVGSRSLIASTEMADVLLDLRLLLETPSPN